jgi:Asp/Glu/hydantoin racemase
MTPVFLLHTAPSLPAVFDGLLTEHVPGVNASHLVDESLLADTVAHGMLPRTRRRLVDHLARAEEQGAQAVLVTCSSLGEAVESARPFVSVPVYRIDVPMVAQAVATGSRIGILATVESTLEPTRRLIEREAQHQGRTVEMTASVCDGAFQALRAGRLTEHDAMVAAEAHKLAATVDVLVLAQASMARVIDALPAGSIQIPVLSSPRSGVAQLAGVADAPHD